MSLKSMIRQLYVPVTILLVYIFNPIENNYTTRNNRLLGYVVPRLDSRASRDDSFYVAYLEYRNIPHKKLRFGSCPCC